MPTNNDSPGHTASASATEQNRNILRVARFRSKSLVIYQALTRWDECVFGTVNSNGVLWQLAQVFERAGIDRRVADDVHLIFTRLLSAATPSARLPLLGSQPNYYHRLIVNIRNIEEREQSLNPATRGTTADASPATRGTTAVILAK